jgi:hypothetical protein
MRTRSSIQRRLNEEGKSEIDSSEADVRAVSSAALRSYSTECYSAICQ